MKNLGDVFQWSQGSWAAAAQRALRLLLCCLTRRSGPFRRCETIFRGTGRAGERGAPPLN